MFGTGEPFITYCAAAVMTFDTDSKNTSTNFGQLLTNYLLTKNASSDDDHMGMTVSGTTFGFKNLGTEIQFIITE